MFRPRHSIQYKENQHQFHGGWGVELFFPAQEVNNHKEGHMEIQYTDTRYEKGFPRNLKEHQRKPVLKAC